MLFSKPTWFKSTFRLSGDAAEIEELDDEDNKDKLMQIDNIIIMTSNGLCTQVPLNILKTPFRILNISSLSIKFS